MKLHDPSLLADLMDRRQVNGAQLGRLAGTSRQFIHQLLKGSRTSCADDTALLIEQALNVGPGALFYDPDVTPLPARRRLARSAA